MNLLRKIKRGFLYLSNQDFHVYRDAMIGRPTDMPDEEYLQRIYRAKMGRGLDLEHPRTFNEKLQWLKLHDRRPIYTTMVDKAAVKDYVEPIIGEEHIIPTLGVWDRFEDIDFDDLPDQFVLKCTHDSGGLVICKDKRNLDMASAQKKIEKSLNTDYYALWREWPYKNVRPRILAEKYMDNCGKDLVDYKFHCFNGEPRVILLCEGRFSSGGLTEDFFDAEWKHLPVRRPKHPMATTLAEKPGQLSEMLAIARRLSEGIPFVRVDLYVIEGRIYFGELTFFPASGLEKFDPESFDSQLGEYLNLPSQEDGLS